TVSPPFRPAAQASSGVNSCALPFSWAARPPLRAISRWRFISIEAKPRFFVFDCVSMPVPTPFIAFHADALPFGEGNGAQCLSTTGKSATPRKRPFRRTMPQGEVSDPAALQIGCNRYTKPDCCREPCDGNVGQIRAFPRMAKAVRIRPNFRDPGARLSFAGTGDRFLATFG